MWTRRDLYVVYLQTTLLDVLADRKTGGKIEGDIRVNVCTPACRILLSCTSIKLGHLL